ncbi:MAG: hypothetical protein IJ192_15140 [Clostridia bacterium]|nr:hypothetical protein [Clostridia bacterium]
MDKYVPKYTLEQIKEMYLAYDGNLYVLWYDYGNDFIESCHYYVISSSIYPCI